MKTNINSNDSSNLDTSKIKKGFKITKEKLDAFEGVKTKYEPVILQYAKNKVAFGFWDFTIKKSKSGELYSVFSGIYLHGFIAFLNHHGFYKRYRPDGSYFFLSCEDNVIEEIEIVQVSDFVTQYLENEATEISFNLAGLDFYATLPHLHETIKKQCHGLFNKVFLQQLPNLKHDILRDTSTTCYKLFSNGVLSITSDGFTLSDYKDLKNKCVWKKQLLNYEFSKSIEFESCHFYRFIRNVSDADSDNDRYLAFITAIGYVLHNYNAPEKGQAIMCYDEVITDITKPQGGTGKGVFANACALLSNLLKIDGKKFDENQRFSFQRVTDSTQIVLFDDVKSKLGFSRFHSILTDGWDIERKNKDEFQIKPKDSPKVILTSNAILSCEGTTDKRRQHPIEFSNFYSKHIINGNEEPIKEIHGCTFFSDDWDAIQWHMFYSFMIDCICVYMQIGLHHYQPKNILKNRLRQVTNDDFATWIDDHISSFKIELDKQYEIKPFFENFRDTYYPDDKFTQRKFTGFLKKYASLFALELIQPPASNGITYFTLKKK